MDDGLAYAFWKIGAELTVLKWCKVSFSGVKLVLVVATSWYNLVKFCCVVLLFVLVGLLFGDLLDNGLVLAYD